MDKITVKLLTIAFHEKVNDELTRILLASPQITIDQAPSFRKLFESELRLLWAGQRTIDQVSTKFPASILTPEYTMASLERSIYLTDEGYPQVILDGFPHSIYTFPVMDTTLTYKTPLSVDFLNSILMTDEDFEHLTGLQPLNEQLDVIKDEDFVVDTNINMKEDEGIHPGEPGIDEAVYDDTESTLMDDEEFYHPNN